MDHQPDKAVARRIARARASLASSRLTEEQLLDRCAELQVAADFGAGAYRELVGLLEDLAHASRDAQFAATLQTRVAQGLVVLRDHPLSKLIAAGQKMEAQAQNRSHAIEAQLHAHELSEQRSKAAFSRWAPTEAARHKARQLADAGSFSSRAEAARSIAENLPKDDQGTKFYTAATVERWLKRTDWTPRSDR